MQVGTHTQFPVHQNEFVLFVQINFKIWLLLGTSVWAQEAVNERDKCMYSQIASGEDVGLDQSASRPMSLYGLLCDKVSTTFKTLRCSVKPRSPEDTAAGTALRIQKTS